ncbi:MULTISPECIES: DoxX family protein [unclassified Brevibacterium]|uniref:DoxX family protein n=1 Tax=unclassified Brevibacterium TaxID=2614124 RepID=UPI001E39A47B|nr:MULTISPECIES: DoxX family protein [unclassified Brevibacterium]MCD1285265.1 DoxX family protein [Brevibacterium sp. CCUG 69071]MDK8434310.1 DoxX family protein [Brevibacterium sp. H-BE7]
MAFGPSLLQTAGRILTAPIFITGGYSALKDPAGKAQMAESTLDTMRDYVPGLPDDNELLVRINGGVQVLAGTTLLLGIKPRLSALALAGSLIPTTVAGHSFWEMEGGDAKAHQTQFSKNLAALGGLLLVAGAAPSKRVIQKAADKAAKKAEKKALKQT